LDTPFGEEVRRPVFKVLMNAVTRQVATGTRKSNPSAANFCS
jgi:hypothetical protein